MREYLLFRRVIGVIWLTSTILACLVFPIVPVVGLSLIVAFVLMVMMDEYAMFKYDRYAGEIKEVLKTGDKCNCRIARGEHYYIEDYCLKEKTKETSLPTIRLIRDE
jgi:hypothetical protein